ncbi:MAG: hypothetical protein OEY80_09875 [Nitrospirota bacterium]|nr:hypothetical protein [Nitrospirota bacterium]MDH5575780.1 hypothetical protein [Nitrospirota bacterium]
MPFHGFGFAERVFLTTLRIIVGNIAYEDSPVHFLEIGIFQQPVK